MDCGFFGLFPLFVALIMALVGMVMGFLFVAYNKYHDDQVEKKRAEEAIEIAVRFGGIDGGHHKAWVIDQMVRALSGDKYEQVVSDACSGEDGPCTYEWDCGIAP